MGALTTPVYGVDQLYLFPRYQTRDAYREATGKEPPPFDPAKPPKYWFDPNAAQSPRRSIVYDPVLAFGKSGVALAGPDGKPALDVLVLSKDEAAAVNIPPHGSNVPGADVPEVPFPLRPLEANEELFFQFGGVVAVKNVELYQALEVGFTYNDRKVLQAIAKKLGV